MDGTTKVFSINLSNGIILNNVFIKEYLSSEENVFIWPSALVLSAYLATHADDVCKNSSFIEIGSGVGLPSIVAARLNAKLCLITEKNSDLNMSILAQNIAINGVSCSCFAKPLNWGDTAMIKSLFSEAENIEIPAAQPFKRFDYILAADVMYSSEDFEDVIATIAALLRLSPHSKCLCAYQQRSMQRTIRPYLDKHELHAEVIPSASFLHSAHTTGTCMMRQQKLSNCVRENQVEIHDRKLTSMAEVTQFNSSVESSHTKHSYNKRSRRGSHNAGDSIDFTNESIRNVPTFDDIHLFRITLI